MYFGCLKYKFLQRVNDVTSSQGTCSKVPEVCYNFFCDFLIVNFFFNFVRLVSVESIDSTII